MARLSFPSSFLVLLLLVPLLCAQPLSFTSSSSQSPPPSPPPSYNGFDCVNSFVDLRPLRALGEVRYWLNATLQLVVQPCGVFPVSDGSSVVNASVYLFNNATFEGRVLVSEQTSGEPYNLYTDFNGSGAATSNYITFGNGNNQLQLIFQCDPLELNKAVDGSYSVVPYFHNNLVSVTIHSFLACPTNKTRAVSSSTGIAPPPPPASGTCVDSQVDLRPLRALGEVEFVLSWTELLIFQACSAFPVSANGTLVNASLLLVNNATFEATVLVGAPVYSDYQLVSYDYGPYYAPYSSYFVIDEAGNSLNATFVCNQGEQESLYQFYDPGTQPGRPTAYFLIVSTRYACPSSRAVSSSSAPRLSSTGIAPPPPPPPASGICVDSQVDLRPLLALGEARFQQSTTVEVVFLPCGVFSAFANGSVVNASLYSFDNVTFEGSVLVGAPAYSAYLSSSLNLNYYGAPYSRYFLVDAAGNSLNATFVCAYEFVEAWELFNKIPSPAGQPSSYEVRVRTRYACPPAARSSSSVPRFSSTGLGPTSSSVLVPSNGCFDSAVDLRPLRSLGQVRFPIGQTSELVFQACSSFPAASNGQLVNASLYLFDNVTFQGTVLVGEQAYYDYQLDSSSDPYRYGAPYTRYLVIDPAGNTLNVTFICTDSSVEQITGFRGPEGAPGRPSTFYLYVDTAYACPRVSSSTGLPRSSSTGGAPTSSPAIVPVAGCANSEVDVRPLSSLGEVRYGVNSTHELVVLPCSVFQAPNSSGLLVNVSAYLANNVTFEGTVLVGQPILAEFQSTPYVLSTVQPTNQALVSYYAFNDFFGNFLSVSFVCDPLTPQEKAVSGAYYSSGTLYNSYAQVNINSSYACPGYTPALTPSSSTGSGTTPREGLGSVEGHTFTTAELAGVVTVAAVLVAVLGACCYLVGRRHSSTSASVPFAMYEDDAGLEQVGMARVQSKSRRPRPDSSSSSGETGEQWRGVAVYPGAMVQSANAYGRM